MNSIQSRFYCHSALLLPMLLLGLLTLTCSCTEDDDNGGSQGTPVLTGKITSYNEFGAAMLDLKVDDMKRAGFTLGDVISITINDKTIEMPYYDGYYTGRRRGRG